MKQKTEKKFKIKKKEEINEVELFELHDGFEVKINGDSLLRLRDNGALTLFAAWYRHKGVLD